MDGAAAASGQTAPAPKPSTKFNRTCSLLRQFIKERGTLGIDIQMTASATDQKHHQTPDFIRRRVNPTMEELGKGPSTETRTAPLFLPDLNSSGSASPAQHRRQIASSDAIPAITPPTVPSPQLTIFYGGKVFVFDNVSQHKARQFMAAASGVSSSSSAQMMPPPGINKAFTNNCHNPSGTAAAAASTVPAPAVAVGTVAGHDAPQHQIPILISGSDLPIARRVSLNRFLEKRKDRISAKAPYQVAGSPDPTSSSKPHNQSSTSGSPSQSADPSGAPSSSKSFPPEDQATAPHTHMPVDGGKQLLVDDDQEEPSSSSLPWLGLAPPPSKPPQPPRNGN